MFFLWFSYGFPMVPSPSPFVSVPGHCAGTLTHLAAGLRERELIFNLNGLDVVRAVADMETGGRDQGYGGWTVEK